MRLGSSGKAQLVRVLGWRGLGNVMMKDLTPRLCDPALVTPRLQALATRERGSAPQVVWICLGNCRKVALLAAFSNVLPALRAALAAGERVVEIR